MKSLQTFPHDIFSFLQTEEAIDAYLEAVVEEGGFERAEERAAFIADAYTIVLRARAIAPLLHNSPRNHR